MSSKDIATTYTIVAISSKGIATTLPGVVISSKDKATTRTSVVLSSKGIATTSIGVVISSEDIATSDKSLLYLTRILQHHMSYCRTWISLQYMLLQQKSSIALVLDCI